LRAGHKNKKGKLMKIAEEKQKYEPVLLELVNLITHDIITASMIADVDDDGWT